MTATPTMRSISYGKRAGAEWGGSPPGRHDSRKFPDYPSRIGASEEQTQNRVPQGVPVRLGQGRLFEFIELLGRLATSVSLSFWLHVGAMSAHSPSQLFLWKSPSKALSNAETSYRNSCLEHRVLSFEQRAQIGGKLYKSGGIEAWRHATQSISCDAPNEQNPTD